LPIRTRFHPSGQVSSTDARRRAVELLRPPQERLDALEDDHQGASVLYDVTTGSSPARWRARSAVGTVHETGPDPERDPGRVCPDNLDIDTGAWATRLASPERARVAGARVAHAPLCLPSSLLRAARPAQGAGRHRRGQRRKYRQLWGFTAKAYGAVTIDRAPRSSPCRWSMGLVASWISFPLLGPRRVETWQRNQASKGREETPLNAAVGWELRLSASPSERG
jgi:hypothetical protein